MRINSNDYYLISIIFIRDDQSHWEFLLILLEAWNKSIFRYFHLRILYWLDVYKRQTGRRFNVKYIPANIDKRHIELIFKNTFLFSEESALKELGYNSSVNYKRKKLFVSYSHANKKIVYSITDKLENYGINLWIDKKSIEFGDNITRSICSGINESDLAILFLSKEIIDSNFSQFELENIISNMIKKSMGWFIVKLDDVNVEEIMPTLGNYLYYDFNENNNIEMLTETIIERINSLW